MVGVSGQKQRTTFAKQQRERARMEKAAEKRARREARKLGTEESAEEPRDECRIVGIQRLFVRLK